MEKNVLPALDQRRWGGIDAPLRMVASRECFFEPAGKDKALGRALANLHSPEFGPADREFYSTHLVDGTYCHPDGRQQRLWSRIEQYNGPRKWRAPFNMVEHAAISSECQASNDNLDHVLAEWLGKIRTLEHVLVPAEQVFDFALGQRGQPVKAVAAELSRRWHGAFHHLDPSRFLDVTPAVNDATGETETSTRLRAIGSCLREGRFEEGLRLVVQMPLGVQRQSVIFFIHKRAELRAPQPLTSPAA